VRVRTCVWLCLRACARPTVCVGLDVVIREGEGLSARSQPPSTAKPSAMFKNTFQSGFLSILYSIGSKPLQIWDRHVSPNPSPILPRPPITFTRTRSSSALLNITLMFAVAVSSPLLFPPLLGCWWGVTTSLSAAAPRRLGSGCTCLSTLCRPCAYVCVRVFVRFGVGCSGNCVFSTHTCAYFQPLNTITFYNNKHENTISFHNIAADANATATLTLFSTQILDAFALLHLAPLDKRLLNPKPPSLHFDSARSAMAMSSVSQTGTSNRW